VRDHPARHALRHGEGVRHHLVGVRPEREDGDEHLLPHLVHGDLVEVDEAREVMGDPRQRVRQRVRRQDARRGVDERLQGGAVGTA
jgi:hypothetical protein